MEHIAMTSEPLLPVGLELPVYEERGDESWENYKRRLLKIMRQHTANERNERLVRTRGEDQAFGTGTLRPPPERAQHDPVELGEVIADEEGAVSQPYRTLDLLERWYRRRDISAESFAAACDFRGDFVMAQYQGLRAVELERIRGGGREPLVGLLACEARERVVEALRALGGSVGDPGGSAAASGMWSVVGEGVSVRDWARRMRWGADREMREQDARTILVCALEVLASHYARSAR